MYNFVTNECIPNVANPGCAASSGVECSQCKSDQGFFAVDYDPSVGSICVQSGAPPSSGGSPPAENFCSSNDCRGCH